MGSSVSREQRGSANRRSLHGEPDSERLPIGDHPVALMLYRAAYLQTIKKINL
jgi:hypothetical protein